MKTKKSGKSGMLWSAVAVLSFFNLLNYVDRYVIAAVGPSMMKDLGLTDGQFGALGSAFLWGFLLASPFASRIIKRLPRLAVVNICVLGWSVAMAATGLVGWMGFLLAARFIFGIFQSIFTASAPPVLEDSVNPNWKARALSMFYLGLPLGTALGFIVGALFERTLGWSLGFVVLGIVGAMISFGVFLIPRRLQKEKVANTWLSDLRSTYSSPTFIWATLGYAAQTFALGAFAFWGPTYIERVFDTPPATGSLMFGGLIVATGIGGSMIGGWATDYFGKTNKLRSALTVSLIATIIATPLIILAFACDSELVFYMTMAVAQTALFATFSPMILVFMGSVSPAARTAAMGVSVFVGRLLGDMISIWLVGVLSDYFQDMRPAMLFLPLALAINASLWLKALRSLPVPKTKR